MAELAELSKPDLVERANRMRATIKRLSEKNSADGLVVKAGCALTARAGGAAAALTEVAALKMGHPRIAAKVPWVISGLNDLASLAFDGTPGKLFDAYTHGFEGYVTGCATRKAVVGA